jgi:MFS family permease
MVVLDVTIINVALPQMRTALHMSTSGQQWVINAYALTFAGFLMLGGRAADVFGRRRVFIIGLAAFPSSACLAGSPRAARSSSPRGPLRASGAPSWPRPPDIALS